MAQRVRLNPSLPRARTRTHTHARACARMYARTYTRMYAHAYVRAHAGAPRDTRARTGTGVSAGAVQGNRGNRGSGTSENWALEALGCDMGALRVGTGIPIPRNRATGIPGRLALICYFPVNSNQKVTTLHTQKNPCTAYSRTGARERELTRGYRPWGLLPRQAGRGALTLRPGCNPGPGRLEPPVGVMVGNPMPRGSVTWAAQCWSRARSAIDRATIRSLFSARVSCASNSLSAVSKANPSSRPCARTFHTTRRAALMASHSCSN
jgi:hypothetical protein